MAGHIKLDRKILQWEWYQDANTCRLFIHLLLNANWQDGKWHGIIIKRGQLITGTEKLAFSLKLGRQSIRTALEKLKITNEITIKVTSKYSIITICKYDYYQSKKSEDNQQNNHEETNKSTLNQPTINQQLTTIEEYNNNNKNNKKINNNRGAGDFQPPTDPRQISGFNYLPDGRSYIEPLLFYKPTDFNGLPEENLKSVIDFFDATKNIVVEPERVIKVWEVFKVQELTEQKPYRNKPDVYRHFLNWCKRQPFGKSKQQKDKPPPKNKKIIGLEFINDFKQCRMSDGSLQDLEINQSDLARYNQISPKDILKK